MALKVGELFASFNIDTSGVSSAVSSVNQSLSSIGKNMMLGGAAMTAAVTAPIKKAASAIYEAGTEFDAEMSKVFAIAGDSVTGNVEVMEALRAKALEMGSTTQFTATEAGEAMEYMAMAGWKSEQMLAAIEPLMNLAAAAGADLGTTSDIVTDAMTAFGLSATDNVEVFKDGVKMSVNAVEYFADILAAASSNSNTNVTMLGESFKFAAPLAGSLGYSVNDVAIALGIMANNGIKSSMAGTSLSRIIQNMAKPSKQTAEAMNALGVSLYNNDGSAKSLMQIMQDFRNVASENGVDVSQLAKDVAELDEEFEAGRITEDQYNERMEKMTAGSGDFLKYVTQIAGARGLPGLLSIMNASEEDFNNLTAAINNATGSASKMKKTMLDNAKGDVTIFQSALEGLEITLWELAESGFRSVVQEATKLVDSFRNASKSTQLGTLKMAGLAAAIGPVTAGLGSVIALLPKLTKLFTIVSGPAAMLALGMVALGAAAIDANNDIGQTFVKGMTAAGTKVRNFGRIVKAQVPALTQNMSNFLSSVREGIAIGLPGIIDGISDVLASGITAISSNMGNIASVSQTIVRTLADSIKRNAPQIVPAVIELLTNMSTALISNVPVVLEGMSTVITSLLSEVQNADWGEVGKKLKDTLDSALKETFTVLKKTALGDKYVEDATWVQVGQALIENIKEGITKASQNAKDLLGNLILGDDYEADDSWGTAAGKIWNKIKSEMSTLLTSAKDLLVGMVLGDDYTADASWGTVATKIWANIKEKFGTLATNAKDLLGTIALGDDYTADDSWSKVSDAIWAKIKEHITSLGSDASELASSFGQIAGELVSSIAGAIPNAIDQVGNAFDAGLALAREIVKSIVSAFDSFNPDLNVGGIAQSLVSNITRALTGALDFGTEVVTAGVKIASGLLDTLIGAFDGAVSTEGVSAIGEKVKGLAQSIISGIVTILPKLFTVGGKAISAGAKLATELVTSLAEGFTGNAGVDIDLTGVAKSLVESISDGLNGLMEFGDQTLMAGAKIAGDIMSSIAESLADTRASGIGDKIGNAGANLVKTLFGNIKTSLLTNPDVIGFLQNLGNALHDGMYIVGDAVGTFITDLIGMLFTPEGLAQLFDFGSSLLNFILQGMMSAADGLIGFVGGIIDSVLDSLGIIDKDKLNEYSVLSDSMADMLIGEVDLNSVEASSKEAFNAVLAAIFNGVDGAGYQELSGAFGDAWSTLSSLVNVAWSGETISADEAKQGFIDAGFAYAAELSDEFWQKFADGWNSNDGTQGGIDFMQYFMTEVLKMDSQPEAETAAAEAGEAAAEATKNAAKEAAIKQFQEDNGITPQTTVKITDQNVSVEGADAITSGIEMSLEQATATVNESGNGVIAAALAVLSAEQGSAIGTGFASAINLGILNMATGAKIAGTSLGNAAVTAARNAVSYLSGHNIGHNFAQGLINGINSMIDAVAEAAGNLGKAAAGSLSGSIQEGSPSKLTAETGRNFGLGFIGSILESVTGAESAAMLVGRSAASSLNQSIHELGTTASDQLSITGRTGRSEAETLAAENEKAAAAYASAIAEALNGASVVMDGRIVGELVTDTVSEGIADRYARKRYGTV